MAINFPDSPTNGQVATIGGKNYTYNSTKNTWTPTQVTEADLSSVGSTTVVATHDLLPSSPSAGDMALVSSVNKMYVYFLSGWWLMSSLQNASPSGITGNAAIYDLATDGTPTTVTLSSSDPEGFPISWSHSVISGSLGGTTVTNVDNVFTITPSTDAADAGTFTLRFAAADGQGGESGSQSQFTLDFVFIVANSRYTTLLATATDTSDNNNITDASTNNHSITVSGDTHAGTFSPYRSGGYSTYFEDTAANVLYASPSSDFAFGTGAFTISVWVKLLHQYLGTIFDTNDGSNPGVMMAVNNTTFYTYSNTWLSSTSTSSQDVWQHFCWTRDGSGNNKVFVNGTQVTTFTDSTNYTSQNFKMGEEQDGTNDLKAYVKDLHIVKGYAYEPDSTYADGAAEPTTGTVFLGCSLPYHGDKSSSPKTLTVASSGISIVNDTPHDYKEYSATDHGGSMNFDGTGDYLTIPDHSSLNFASNDWTIECWIYPRTNVGDCGIWHQSASGGLDWFGIYLDGSFNPKFVLKNNNSTQWDGTAASNTAPQNTWTHIALVRQFGTGVYLYAGGTLVASDTGDASVAMEDKTYNHVIGYERFVGSGTYFDGLISDFKMDIGTAHYTGEFTPPPAPLSSTAADLHIKGTDASIIDKSQGDNLKLVGNTTGSTTQVKFAGTKSMYFDGNQDMTHSVLPAPLASQATIEFWMYSSATNKRYVFGIGIYEVSSFLGIDTYGGVFKVKATSGTSGSTTQIIADVAYSANTWYHVAIVRDGTTYELYVDGISKGTGTYGTTTTYDNSYDVTIGTLSVDGTSTANPWSGYIQDFRITNGLARYTANFTPPTASLEG